MANLRYPIGMQSFQEIRENGYLYVDKTRYIHELASGGKYYFLSRPRRFGKSLLISTIEQFFKGNHHLFEGLAISRQPYDWDAYPVLHIDLAGCSPDSVERLAEYFNDFLTRWEIEYGIISDSDKSVGLRFKYIIIKAHEQTGKPVVILVDEYDKPLLETVDNPELQERIRRELRMFYSNLKSLDGHIRFAMLTGVTKLGHLSIFSDLNNLQDISLSMQYNGICGITKEELHEYFDEGIRKFSKNVDKTPEEIYEKLRENYDGYHFTPKGGEDVYNPFSLLNCMSEEWFGNYWFRTGTPSFLIKMIRVEGLPLPELASYEIGLSSLSDVSFQLTDIIPVLYQSGYLTIKGYDERFDIATLGFPNKEVENGFFNQLMPLNSGNR
ncbi:MAG: AAA family ATPase [Muribaculaceae bacterium]